MCKNKEEEEEEEEEEVFVVLGGHVRVLTQCEHKRDFKYIV